MEGTTFKVFSLKQEVIANCPAPRFISYKRFHALFQIISQYFQMSCLTISSTFDRYSYVYTENHILIDAL